MLEWSLCFTMDPLVRISQSDFALKDYDQTSFLFKYEAKLSPQMCLSCLTINDLLIVYGEFLVFHHNKVCTC